MTDTDPNYDRRERIFVAIASLASLVCLGLNLTAHFTGDRSGDYMAAVVLPFLLPLLLLIHFPFQKWDRSLALQVGLCVGIVLFLWLSPFTKLFIGLWSIFAFWLVIVHHRCLRSLALKLPFIFFTLGIAFCGNWLQIDNQRYLNYARWISLSVIQFGDIDGDGKTDLITSGYKGMVGGNPRWYRGNGKDFGEWEDGVFFATPQASPLMIELNGDGQIDMIDNNTFYQRESSDFKTLPAPQNRDPKDSSFFTDNDFFLNMTWIVPSGLYFHTDLDKDKIEEVFCFGEGRLIFSFREKGSWVTRSFAMPTLFDVRDYHLSFSADVSKAALDLIKSKKWPYRLCPVPANSILPSEQNAYSLQEKQLIDFDGDGLDELAVCALDEVKIYRQKDGQFRDASTVKHSNLNPMIYKDYFFWIEQFGDFK